MKTILLQNFQTEEHTVSALGLSRVYNALKSFGCAVYFNDGQVSSPSKRKYDFVGTSIVSLDWPEIAERVQFFRKHYPRAKIVFGGPGVEHHAIVADLHRKYPNACIFRRGQIPLLVKELLGYVPEIATHPTPPAYACYTDAQLGKLNRVSLLSYAGCQFNCTFCSSMFDDNFEIYARTQVLGELKDLAQRGVRRMDFLDACFFRSPNWREYAQRSHEMGIRFGCISDLRPPLTVDDFKKAVDLGLYYCIFGVETFNQGSLNAIHKQIDAKASMKLLRKLAPRAPHRSVFLMGGLPFQTYDDVQRDLDLCRDAGVVNPILSMLRRFAWSDYTKYAPGKGEGIYFNRHGELTHTDWMTSRQVHALNVESYDLYVAEMTEELSEWYT